MRYLVFCFVISALLLGCKNGNQQKPGAETDTLAMLSALIKKEPKNADLYYQQAKFYLGKSRLGDALESCNKAISLDDKNAKYYVLLADIFLGQGQSEACIGALEKTTSLEPQNVQAIVKLAEVSMVLRNYDRAISEADKAISLDKLNPNAYFIKGFTLKEKGDTLSAVALYKEVIKIDPDYEMAYEELGMLYALRKDKVAEDYLKTAFRINPKNVQAMYSLAMYYQDAEQIEEAHNLYENILAIAPNHIYALHNIGYIELVYNENYNEAIKYFDRAIEASPNYIEALFNRGFAYEKLGKKAEAIKDYKAVEAINPQHQKSKEALKRLGVK